MSTADIQNAATVQQTDFHLAFAYSVAPNIAEYISKGKTSVIGTIVDFIVAHLAQLFKKNTSLLIRELSGCN